MKLILASCDITDDNIHEIIKLLQYNDHYMNSITGTYFPY